MFPKHEGIISNYKIKVNKKGKKKGWAKAQPFKEKLFSKSLRAGTKVPVPKKGGTEVPLPKRGGNKFPLPKRN